MNSGALRKLLKLVLPALLAATVAAQAQPKPVKATKPLTADQVAVYRAFLKHYMSQDSGTKSVLNIARTTTPFKPDSSDLKKGGCLKEFTPLPKPAGVHTFTNQFAGMKDVRLVDPAKHKFADPGVAIRHGVPVDKAVDAGLAAGLFTFSGVVFDPTHHYAAVGYTFYCGFTCGNGGTEVFKIDHGEWRPTHRHCSGWVS